MTEATNLRVRELILNHHQQLPCYNQRHTTARPRRWRRQTMNLNTKSLVRRGIGALQVVNKLKTQSRQQIQLAISNPSIESTNTIILSRIPRFGRINEGHKASAREHPDKQSSARLDQKKLPGRCLEWQYRSINAIIRYSICIYLLLHLASHDNDWRLAKIDSVSAQDSDLNHQLRYRSYEVSDRIDSLLTRPTAYKSSDETPLDFIKRKQTANKDNDRGDDWDKQASLHKRHRHRRAHRSQHHHQHSDQSRSRRNFNNAEGYLDLGADRPVVLTNKGLVKGITQKIFTNKFVDAYLGIPFAQPPLGPYRFRHPQPVNPWPGEFDASRLSNSCFQVNDTFFGSTFMGTSIWNANTPLDEDCLYLNIWTPFGAANTTITPPLGAQRSLNNYDDQNPSSSSSGRGARIAKRPVLVWIFGGGFYSGTSTLKLYEGGALASEEDIIVVSMNYRVSSLGFLYFGRPDAPGNAGMFDQLLALQWINDNIDQFGGDPDRVTIFGESAGAVSVAFHLLSPLSRNLFSQAILQSGAATCPWGLMDTREIIANGLQLASLLNCPSNQHDLDAVIKCLLKADPMALVSQEVGQTRSVLNFPFVPVVDGSFLLEPPVESLAKANFKRARVLLGSNNDEANAFLIYLPEFSNCPANNANPTASESQAVVPAVSEMMLPKQTDNDDQDQAVASMNDHSDVHSGATVESVDGLTSERQTSSRAAAGLVNDYNNSSGVQQSSSNSAQSSTKTNQKQQQQANAQNADTSKPCKPNEYLSLTRDDFLNMLREDLNPYAGHKIGKKAIVFEYSNWNNPMDPVSFYDAIDKIVGDYHFTCHVNEFAYHYARAGNPVYMYYFKHRSTMSPWPKWMGVLHADEINFVFGEPLNPVYNYTKKEIDLSRRMMKYWANFARFGNPTPKNADNRSMSQAWPEYKDKREYFELNSDYTRIGRGPRAKQCAFWAQYLPQLVQSYDNDNRCRVPGAEPVLSPHLYPSQTSSQQPNKYAYPRLPHDFIPFASTPSTILFSFIFIIILVGAIGTYIIYNRGFSWKFDLWPTSSNATSTRRSDEEEGDDGAGSSGRRGQSRVGRWRNQRAAASRQRTNAAAAAAAAASPGTAVADGSSSTAPPPQAQIAQTVAATVSATTSSSVTTSTAATNQRAISSTFSTMQQSQPSSQNSRLGTMQMQQMRPQMVSQPSAVGGNGGGGSATLFRQQLSTGNEQQQAASSDGEQSAFELAQSAAARVTASGSAAAAMAAAKFKMLRSNTLAAAFGRQAEGAETQAGSNSTTANRNGAQTHSVAADLIALRTKDERIVNTLSSSASRFRRSEMN